MAPKVPQILIIITSFLLSPLIALMLICLFVYRRMVDVVLRFQLNDKYAGLLDGTDCVWAIEDPTGFAVINVLLILEKDARHSNVNFLENFRSLVKHRMVDAPFKKLRCSRKKKFGYYFWERCDHIDLEQRVRWLEYERTNCDGSCDNIYNGHLKRVLWNVCNQPLPEDHTASWEILIGKCCPRSSSHYLRRMEERVKNGKIRIPILFRVHHSLGDGMALLKLFREAIIDKEPMQETYLKFEETSFRINTGEVFETLTVTVPRVNYPENCVIEDKVLPYPCRQDIMSATMPFIHLIVFSHFFRLLQRYFDTGVKSIQHLSVDDLRRDADLLFSKKWNHLKGIFRVINGRMKKFLKTILVVISAPICLVQQAARSLDHSALHGPVLSGDKIVSYWLEDDFKNSNEQRLFTKIQNIKNLTGARFGDVLLAALSVSLHKYFLRVNQTPPDTMSVVLPSRLEDWGENLPLQNNFSVGVLPLCISRIGGQTSEDPIEDTQILDRLEDIKSANDKLKRSADYTVNFLVMKYLSAALPEKLLTPVLESHSTMVFSNLVGPQEVQILGHHLKNIVFWIPSRSFTGIGCSLLTYRGYLHLSLMADKVLIRDEKLLTEILENTVQEIDSLYDRLTTSSLSKRLHGRPSTPTKKEIGVL